MRWFYYVGRILVRILLLLFTRWQVTGRDNIPVQGPLLVIVNHLNLADPPILAVSLNRKAMFMAKEGLFRTKLSNYFIRGLGGFPVRRERMQREALIAAEQVLNNGYALCIFPEGMRSRTAQLRQAFPGAAMIAIRTGVPILPAAITGTETVKGAVWLRRPRLTVTFGQPFQLPPPAGNNNRDKCAEYIMERIAELLPPEYRGVYANTGTEQAT